MFVLHFPLVPEYTVVKAASYVIVRLRGPSRAASQSFLPNRTLNVSMTPISSRETKLIIGFDFAVTLSSPESFCVLFDITSRQLMELKMADVEQTHKMIPFITCEISLCQYVCDLVLGVNVSNLNPGIQLVSFQQSIKSNSVGSGNMSHCGASSLYGNSG